MSYRYVYTGYVVVILWFINLECRIRTHILQPQLNRKGGGARAGTQKIRIALGPWRVIDTLKIQTKSGNEIGNGATSSPKKNDAFIAAKSVTEGISNCVRRVLRSMPLTAKKSMIKFAAMLSTLMADLSVLVAELL